MRHRTTRHRRVASGVLAGALLLVPLSGCSGTSDSDADATPEVTAMESTPAEETSESPDTGANGTEADVDCSGRSCSVTLTGNGAEADILGTPVVLETVADGRARCGWETARSPAARARASRPDR